MSQPQRIPVYLLTGFLGSGKTTLLKNWLTQPEFKDAALIINELGEVGLDNQLLSAASESSSLVANACVCCTGLPGLEEAMEELFWARLHRRIPAYPCLVIETTGLADPGPVVASLQNTELLRERFQLAGVITCLSANTADAVLPTHTEARAQLAAANLLVLSKTDLVSPNYLSTLQRRLRYAHPDLPLALSSQADLTAAQVLALLPVARGDRARAGEPADAHHHAHAHHHDHAPDVAHDASAHWLPVPGCPPQAQLLEAIAQLQTQLGPRLLRLKGRVQTVEGALLIQLVPFQAKAEVAPDALARAGAPAQRHGLTLIVAGAADASIVATWERTLPGWQFPQ